MDNQSKYNKSTNHRTHYIKQTNPTQNKINVSTNTLPNRTTKQTKLKVTQVNNQQ